MLALQFRLCLPGRRTKNQLSPGLFRCLLSLSLTSHVDVVGEDGLLEGADLAGVLPTVHTLRQTDDQLAAVLQLHNLPPDTEYAQLGRVITVPVN